jgi:hypothetical protein
MSAQIEIPDGPPWPAALAGCAGAAAELNRALRALAEEHRALVADVHARFLGQVWPPATLPSRPPDHAIVACGTAA